MKGTRALAAEEDLARALLAALSKEQRAEVVTDATAPADILTSASRKAAILANVGLAANRMTGTQQGLLMSLIEEHAVAQSPASARERMRKVHAETLADIRFNWMGPTEKAPGNGHYYRVQGRTFLIEYDNIQNNANHQHIVWRDFDGDFGLDVLAEHYASDAGHAPE
jgi:hypothetical protein